MHRDQRQTVGLLMTKETFFSSMIDMRQEVRTLQITKHHIKLNKNVGNKNREKYDHKHKNL